MRFIQLGLSILAVVMLLISLYRFVEGFQNWQEARQIKQRSLDELAALERDRDHLKGSGGKTENGRTHERAIGTTTQLY